VSVFSGKVAIITGGASGIGRALGEALAREGAEVVLADLRGERALEVAAEIVKAGGRARGVALDVCNATAFAALVTATVAESGRLDYLFNNAGIAISGEARDMTLDDWNRVLAVNLHGVVHGVAAAYPVMLAQKSGHIVNTASLAGLTANPGLVAYAASKHAVVGLSTSLRAEAADLGVRVSVVCPGLIDTPIITDSRFVNLDREGVLAELPFAALPAAECAQAILRGVKRNQPVIVVTRVAKLLWLLQRVLPSGLTALVVREIQRRIRRHRRVTS
jgi:NAD(P)-dependent dehydrogenase (short-subunit alcohol dehydrogenase family)